MQDVCAMTQAHSKKEFSPFVLCSFRCHTLEMPHSRIASLFIEINLEHLHILKVRIQSWVSPFCSIFEPIVYLKTKHYYALFY